MSGLRTSRRTDDAKVTMSDTCITKIYNHISAQQLMEERLDCIVLQSVIDDRSMLLNCIYWRVSSAAS
eukprot:scaffold269910_cov16-Prasinocladus_malaysianus.AAC.1